MPEKTRTAEKIPPCEQFAELGKKTIKKNLELCEKTVLILQQMQAKGQLTAQKWNEIADKLRENLDKKTSQITGLLKQLPQEERKEAVKQWEKNESFEEDIRDGIVPAEVKAEVLHIRELVEELIPCPTETQLTLMQRNAEFVDSIIEGGTRGNSILRAIGLPVSVQIARIRSCMITAALAGPSQSPNLHAVEMSCAIAKRKEEDDGKKTFDKLREGGATPLGLAKRKQELLYAIAVLKEAEGGLKAEEARREEQLKWQGDDEDVLGGEPDTEEVAGLSKIEILNILEAEEPDDDEFDLGKAVDVEADDKEDDIKDDVEFEKQRWMDRIPEQEHYRWDGLMTLYAELRVRGERIFPILKRLSKR